MTVRTRGIRMDDLPSLLALNNDAVPAVNALDEESFGTLIGLSHRAVVLTDVDQPGVDLPGVDLPGVDLPGVDLPDERLGFALALLPGAPYESENYRWFSERSARFLYVDRIVIGEGSRSRGLGQLLYDDLFAVARAADCAEIFCEVNLQPPNPGSLAFHRRLGFEQLGTQETKNGSVVVSLLGRRV